MNSGNSTCSLQVVHSPALGVPATQAKISTQPKIEKTKIIASGPITSRQIYGGTVTDFILGGSKITADGDFRHKIKTLAPWRDQPRQHIKKQRHYFANKDPLLVKAMFFPVVKYGCERWTIKKAEH